ncbi:hypothetical protein [Gordonia jinghuaiqii]|nr:hypothetical protein [Gordonia jinghuaiqii]
MVDDAKINGLEQARRAAMLAADTTALRDLLAVMSRDGEIDRR